MLQQDVFYKDGLALARFLLGKVLVHCTQEGEAAGIIVETEAYCGETDAACHVYGGRITPRTQVLYQGHGLAYPYVIYGMHTLLNITGGVPGHCALVRALQPLRGVPLMQQRRGVAKPINLANGPGKLCCALGIDRGVYGAELWGKTLYLETDGTYSGYSVGCGKRIGVEYAGEASLYPWRFGLMDSPYLSKPLEMEAGFCVSIEK